MAIFNGKIHYKWPFPIATLNYQRVAGVTPARLAKHQPNRTPGLKSKHHVIAQFWFWRLDIDIPTQLESGVVNQTINHPTSHIIDIY